MMPSCEKRYLRSKAFKKTCALMFFEINPNKRRPYNVRTAVPIVFLIKKTTWRRT
jgi:hypothetical protein